MIQYDIYISYYITQITPTKESHGTDGLTWLCLVGPVNPFKGVILDTVAIPLEVSYAIGPCPGQIK